MCHVMNFIRNVTVPFEWFLFNIEFPCIKINTYEAVWSIPHKRHGRKHIKYDLDIFFIYAICDAISKFWKGSFVYFCILWILWNIYTMMSLTVRSKVHMHRPAYFWVVHMHRPDKFYKNTNSFFFKLKNGS